MLYYLIYNSTFINNDDMYKKLIMTYIYGTFAYVTIYAVINTNSFFKNINGYFWCIYLIDFFSMIVISNIYLEFTFLKDNLGKDGVKGEGIRLTTKEEMISDSNDALEKNKDEEKNKNKEKNKDKGKKNLKKKKVRFEELDENKDKLIINLKKKNILKRRNDKKNINNNSNYKGNNLIGTIKNNIENTIENNIENNDILNRIEEENDNINKLRDKNNAGEMNENLSLNILEEDINKINEYDSQINYLNEQNIANIQKNYTTENKNQNNDNEKEFEGEVSDINSDIDIDMDSFEKSLLED